MSEEKKDPIEGPEEKRKQFNWTTETPR